VGLLLSGIKCVGRREQIAIIASLSLIERPRLFPKGVAGSSGDV
jgi:hypothetical protein